MIDLSRTALIELTEAAWVFLGSSHPVDPSDKDLIEEISHNGLAVIRGFYDRVKVEALKKEIDRIFHEHSETVWSDPQGSDHRMFQAEIFSEALKEYLHEPRIERIARHFSRSALRERTVLAARMRYKPGNQGSGAGWHRDSPVSRQFKSLVYLCEVDESNGPFEYIIGSHRKESVLSLVARKLQRYRQYRFTDEEIEGILKISGLSKVQFRGKAGDLVLVNTKGIHRGAPMLRGERYALTNYFFRGARPEAYKK